MRKTTNSAFIYLFLATIFSFCSQTKKTEIIVIKKDRQSPASQLGVPENLSEWDLFEKPLSDLVPKSDVLPYDLNTPLFTDYAFKSRFVKVGSGSITYNSSDVFDFPIGTVLIKNFYYPADFTDLNGIKYIIETRILSHDSVGWNAFTYVWNHEQTEATLSVSGESIPVTWRNNSGVLEELNYSVPNLAQCKNCHEKSGKMTPIGPSARQLNKSITHKSTQVNVLMLWSGNGILKGLPSEFTTVPKLVSWDDESQSINARARAWLEINCAHCHNPEGPAKNTGLYLTHDQPDPYRIGIMKPPVAAGRASLNLSYAIFPNHPEESILFRRLVSLDPGVMMPEIGRKMVHIESADLIRKWIETGAQ